jgi:acetyltransferase-like isoleucine patch superfamily enzyme
VQDRTMEELSRRAQWFANSLRTLVWRVRYAAYVRTTSPDSIRGGAVRLRPLWVGGKRLRVSLDPGAFLVGPMVIQGSGTLTIGSRSYVNQFAVIGVADRITVGQDCLIGPHVGIRDSDHAFRDPTKPIREQGTEVAAVTIEDDVWVGQGAVITKGVTVGRGAVIAAGAVVVRDVAPYTIVGGVPAREIGRRSPG